MKKHHYFYLFYLTISLLCSAMSYPVAAELKIGFVNALKIMDKAPQVDSANRRLEREFAPRQRKLVSAKKQIQKLEKRFSKDAAIMSESEARRLSRDIREKRRDLKRKQEEFREDYNIRRNEELDKIQKIILEVIQKLARAERYDLIFTEGVVFANKRVDITNKVLKRLKRKNR